MHSLSVLQVGGVSARLAALSLSLFTLFVVLAASVDQPAWYYVLADYALAVAGLLGLAAVPAVAERVVPLGDGLARAAGRLATVGFAVVTVLSFWQAEYETAQALAAAVPADGARVLLADALASRVPKGWADAGLIGLWVLSVSWLARPQRLIPPGLVRLGLVAGALTVGSALGAAAGMPDLVRVGQFAGTLVLVPAWLAWMGTVLLRAAAPHRGDGEPMSRPFGPARPRLRPRPLRPV